MTENPQTASILSAIADSVDADTLHLSERAKAALSRLNAALARQATRNGSGLSVTRAPESNPLGKLPSFVDP